ncbi:MAG: hypothetical protein N4A54_04145 [Peptostreptococcaceae bacterium]|jgi:hypothetical protein|nr:hypothetical protein [Peptostreptococcaceae bacterium]
MKLIKMIQVKKVWYFVWALCFIIGLTYDEIIEKTDDLSAFIATGIACFFIFCILKMIQNYIRRYSNE